MDKLIKYFKGAIDEMRKVTWPTRQETYSYTLLVVVSCVVMALFLGGVDLGFAKIIERIINR